MAITLKPEHEQLIQTQIQNGRFPDANAVLEAALKLLISEDAQSYFTWLTETRKKVAVGISELDRGEGQDAQPVIDLILAQFQEARQVAKSCD
ncbi:MAG TPA: type II toxin-antitoxin system ParD family antitoxin [Cyanobacteria bacterium UBA11149]|nr:type II toxin-antitoxin system ParD family antitoxin [Cyanobacteria bacterium UBA11367]HBE57573.1 type II toxin-antitoxin system ParD family antitoxin [Cyanobacteria bacterium UBA11366]HBK63238.1 type II toxin-antitoxin system ParD family antitoxin [Cyanobacteria bacterium UBA11166]HBR73301.1 type II toxin-antitoxin system ParD family antitoxin [Cyanobacteria bacterium UBA11159]HBS67751.1 type II toxin-antitoxin system ParD family antitoxin [Cyanobacteria bacterium UBA11153]HBW92030.1 type 